MDSLDPSSSETQLSAEIRFSLRFNAPLFGAEPPRVLEFMKEHQSKVFLFMTSRGEEERRNTSVHGFVLC